MSTRDSVTAKFGWLNFALFALCGVLWSAMSLAASTAVTLTSTPPVNATVGTAYSYWPAVKNPAGGTLSFSMANKPAWLTLSKANGHLSGTPTSANVGTTWNVGYTVSNGKSSSSAPVFRITVKASTSSSTPATNSAPKISGSPATTATVGSAYAFTPSATDANGDTLAFSISNKPSWAAFSTSTGKLSGTPAAANVSTFSNIAISVSDGKASAALPAFAIAVKAAGGAASATGGATVTWMPPTQNTNGTTLTNLSGYRIHYGTVTGALGQLVQISGTSLTSYYISNLTAGTWYFVITAVNSMGVESAGSNMASKVIK